MTEAALGYLTDTALETFDYVPALKLCLLESKNEHVWYRLRDDATDEWQLWPGPYSFLKTGLATEGVKGAHGTPRVTVEEVNWLSETELKCVAELRAKTRKRRGLQNLFVNLERRAFSIEPVKEFEVDYIDEQDYLLVPIKTGGGLLDERAQDTKWSPITPLFDGTRRDLLLLSNGLHLLADANETVKMIEDPRVRTFCLASLAAAESKLCWDTKHLQLAKAEAENVEGFEKQKHRNTTQCEENLPVWLNEQIESKKSEALGAIAIAQIKNGRVKEARETLCTAPDLIIKAFSCGKVAARQVLNGDFDGAQVTCELAEEKGFLQAGLEDVAKTEERNGRSQSASSIRALRDWVCNPKCLTSWPVNQEPPGDSLPTSERLRRECEMSGKQELASAIGYARDDLYDVAEGKALQISISRGAATPLAVIGLVEVINGLDGRELFKWAKLIPLVRRGELRQWAKLTRKDQIKRLEGVGQGQKKRLRKKNSKELQTPDLLKARIKQSPHRFELDHNDKEYLKIAPLEAEAGIELCTKAYSNLSQLSPEDRIGLVAKHADDPRTLKALGAFLTVEQQGEAVSRLENRPNTLGLSLKLRAGAELLEACKNATGYVGDVEYVPVVRHNPLVVYVKREDDLSRQHTAKRQLRLSRKGASMSSIRVFGKENGGVVLTRQKKINAFNFPFTLNTTIGCLFNCRYCYLQTPTFSRHAKFGEEMIVKEHIIPKLKRELKSYRKLPLHLRRVQIGPATEVYHPLAVKAFEEDKKSGLISNVIEAFLDDQEAGYPWAIHLVTKSPLIEKDVELLKRLVCFQAEITITTLSEDGKRQWEGSAPSVARRLETIKRLSDQGIFVRVMAMPLFLKPGTVAVIKQGLATSDRQGVADVIEKARWEEGNAIWEAAKSCGAQAFKAKGLNYFDPQQLDRRGAPAKRVKGRNEDPNKEMLFHSGEIVRNEDDSERTVEVRTWWYEEGERELQNGTKKKIKKLRQEGSRRRPVMDFGYQLMEKAKDLNWGDCLWSGRETGGKEESAQSSKNRQEEADRVIEVSPTFFLIGWCPHCHKDSRLRTNSILTASDGRRYRKCTCAECNQSFQYFFEGLRSRERFRGKRFPFSNELYDFMDQHPEFLESLKILNPRFYFLPQVILSTQPLGEEHAQDQVIGLFYLDQLHLQEGKKPLFKQDFIVNVGRQGGEFVSYSALQENGPYVRPITDFFRTYGKDGKYYHRSGERPWEHHYDDAADLPQEVQDSALRALKAVSGSPGGNGKPATDSQEAHR